MQCSLCISNQYETKCEKIAQISLKPLTQVPKKGQYTVVCDKIIFLHQIKVGNVDYTCQTYKWKYSRPMLKMLNEQFIQLWMSYLESKLTAKATNYLMERELKAISNKIAINHVNCFSI